MKGENYGISGLKHAEFFHLYVLELASIHVLFDIIDFAFRSISNNPMGYVVFRSLIGMLPACFLFNTVLPFFTNLY